MNASSKKAIAGIMALAFQLQVTSPVWAALAQVPLISNSATTVSPNVILTLDNSESMALNHMPEDLAGTNIVRMHPDDNLSTNSHIYLTSVAGFVPATGSCAPYVYECKLRSAAVNTIYYNPATLYKPWIDPNNPSLRLSESKFNAAPVTPGSASSRLIDLSVINNRILNNWCTASNRCNSEGGSSLRFNPGIFYVLPVGSDPDRAANYKLYDLNGGGVLDYGREKYPNRKDCGDTCTIEQEKQNFANWFTYYRARILFTKAAVSEAFAAQGNRLRLGWGATGNATSANTVDGAATIGGPLQGVRDFDASYKITFLNTIQGMTLRGSTPLRYAMAGVGKYFQRQDAHSPWRDHPEATSDSGTGNALACRRAYNIMTTDGYYNDNGSVDSSANYPISTGAVGEVDNTTVRVDGTDHYVPTAPFRDSGNASSLADIAMYYWANDLQPGTNGIANRVPTIPGTFPDGAAAYYNPSNDPATWQHLTQFTVGIGVSGSLNPSRDLAALQSGTLQWPVISADNTKIDDLWHAAVNSRGKFFQVSNPQDLSDALTTALTAATVDPLKQSGVATTTVSLESQNDKFVSEFNAAGWTGDVKAYAIDKDTGDIDIDAPKWVASEKLPSSGSRNIWTWKPGSGLTPDNGTAVAFSLANLESAGTNRLIPEAFRTEALVNYIRGSSADEGVLTGQFRPRTVKLGDFINSTPVFVKGLTSISYSQLGGKAFTDYVANKASRQGLLLIGSNDGMLHGFDEETGVETFAYIPHGVIANLHKLADQSYGSSAPGAIAHQYYVDGPLTEADAYIATKKNATPHWSNVVIGTLGAGGTSIFAIDVTGTADSSASSTSLNASSVLWEINADNSSNLGKITSPAQVGVLQGGGWKVFVGNGYDSSSNRAALLVIDLATGKIDKTFLLGSDTTTPNGLGGINLLRNSQNEVVSAYGGDLQGNLWRVDFADGTKPDTWTVGFGGQPLFTTGVNNGPAQPITAPPVVTTVGGKPLVIFGTGSLLTTEDQVDKSLQSIYAVWDDPQRTLKATRGKLVQQTISSTVDSQGYYAITSNPVNLGISQDWGWYIDLTIEPKQRVIYPLQVIDDLVFIPSVVPAAPAASPCDATQGTAYNFLLPTANGGRPSEPILDTNGDGVVNGNDTTGVGYKTLADGPSKILLSPTGAGSIQNSGEKDQKFRTRRPCTAGICPPINDITDRVWKQLVNPPF